MILRCFGKSPKSPKLSKEESSSENEELKVKVSLAVPPLGSEKGPKPSCEEERKKERVWKN